ncbi:hypothetical protein SCHIN_v1c06620 [Spiroplasma chinense]|uniref:Helix-turn-helix domain-containing protein n=1 Tax=Spiroplasma chinense TaxID=216932 RepID=A0A5B9Y588_9MOLU|nr:hypothetical protein [Spiroplasma chinense]QEH61859.1 hypothetical protein SCHIN_v1c06620 [Spiroplasma chinense]
MLKIILKDLDIRISELSKFLGITRPTLYKFIDLYENNEKQLIPKNYLEVLEYIENNKDSTKNHILQFLIKRTGEQSPLQRIITELPSLNYSEFVELKKIIEKILEGK